MVVAFKQRSGDLSFIQIHLLEVKPLPSHKAGWDEHQALRMIRFSHIAKRLSCSNDKEFQMIRNNKKKGHQVQWKKLLFDLCLQPQMSESSSVEC